MSSQRLADGKLKLFLLVLAGSGCFWVVLARSGWFWVVLARSGWFWLVPSFSKYELDVEGVQFLGLKIAINAETC